MRGDRLKRLTELEKENQRLRWAVPALTLGEAVLAEAAWGSSWALCVVARASTTYVP